LYLVGSFVLVSLAGCGRGFFQAEREPWRAEAEVACLKSGAVKEGPGIVRIDPISGPGVCGADFPLHVSLLGEEAPAYGFADEDLRPPAPIGNQPRWPIAQEPPRTPRASSYPPPAYPRATSYPQPNSYPPAQSSYPQNAYPQNSSYPDQAGREPAYGAAASGPVSLTAPGVSPGQGEINLPPDGVPPANAPAVQAPYTSQPYPPAAGASAPYSPAPYQSPRLGPPAGNPVTAAGPVEVKPTATLACPIVAVLNRWLDEQVQPAAMRWFGVRVVEIQQISAYSCRGMNGNPHAHISEHAFGNALDIAAFTLADGRRITVKDGWHGRPEEQGFLRDVQGAACQDFTTVLAPGANVYHYNHIHVDLMRRARRPLICEPAPVSGAEVAARAARRYPYALRDPSITGALGSRKEAARHKHEKIDEEDVDDQ
jgi:hypothetical protein